MLWAVLSAFVLVVIHGRVPFLAPLALIPLLYAIQGGQPFRKGWLTGTLTWGALCFWIQGTLARHGGMDEWLSYVMLILFAIAKGLHTAVFAWAAKPLLKLGLWAPPLIAALWTGIERTHGDLGFAWLTLGNAGIDSAFLARLAPYTGVYGLSFLFALTAASALAIVKDRRNAAWLVLWLVPFALPALLEHQPDQVAVAVQPNFDEATPPRDPYLPLFELTAHGLREAKQKPAAVLWPEVPVGVYYDTDLSFRLAAGRFAREQQMPFILGTVAFANPGQPRNSAQFIGPTGAPGARYDKVNLVPFGEFVPWPLAALVDKVSTEAGTFTPGDHTVVNGQWGAFICYESAFPTFVREFTKQGAEVLVNLTNDGYFARSAARQQHISLARMRAVENGRWLLRATNDGYTMSISPAGRIAAEIEPYKPRAAVLPFSFEKNMTFYVRYGDWFAWSCLAIGLGGLLYVRVKLRG